MPRYRFASWQLFHWVPRRSSSCVFILPMAAVIGCGNSCFIGFFNNGNGGAIIKAGNPPPPCSLPQTNGMMTVLAVKSSMCESCAAPQPQHVFVTLQGIQLHLSAIAEPTSPDWREIAPQLRDEPMQIDLTGGSVPEVLVGSSPVPAGTYRQLRLRFLPDSSQYAGKRSSENPCGEAGPNCVIMADGRVDKLAWPAEEIPDLLITGDAIQSGSLVVLPDAKMDLLLSFRLTQMLYSFGAEGVKPRAFLAGHVTVQQSLDGQPSSSTN